MQFLELKSGTSTEGAKIPAHLSDVKTAYKHFIYLIAGVHGDEVEGVFLLQKLFASLHEDGTPVTPLVVLPILNPDGYRTGTRTNASGVDLNRNCPSSKWTAEFREKKYFPGQKAGSEQENKFLFSLFNKYPPGFIMSFHSWKPMLNFNGNCKEVAEFLSQFNGYPVVDDIIDYPTPGSLGEFGPEKFNAPVLTFELPPLSSGKTLKEIWEENSIGLCALFRSDLLRSFC